MDDFCFDVLLYQIDREGVGNFLLAFLSSPIDVEQKMLAWSNSYNEVISFYGAKTDSISITYIYSYIKIACSNLPLHFTKEVWAVAGTFTPS